MTIEQAEMKKEANVKKKVTVSKKSVGVKVRATKAPVKKAYLTKRVLLSAVNKGIKLAAERTMKVQGYTVVAEDGWVVKVYANGEKEKIKKIATATRTTKITLR